MNGVIYEIVVVIARALVLISSVGMVVGFDVVCCRTGVVPADNVPAGRSSSIPADYVSASHVLVPADSDRIC
ncbi:hypothetical protein Tco_0606019 [Tanacetum coccineum]